MRAIVSIVRFTLQLFFDVVILFFLFALMGAFWGRNTDEVLHEEGVPLFIHGDGFHTELYLPVNDSLGIINWMDWFDDATIKAKHQNQTLINFAWAEYDWTLAGVEQKPKGIKTTLEIFFWPKNKSVMHVQWMNELWTLKHPVTLKRFLSAEQYRKLIVFIKNGFELEDGKPIIRSYKGYYGWDYLYLSNRNYNSFNTCNQWTSDALNAGGVRNATFSPFGWGVLYQLKKEQEIVKKQ
ncbi:MAG: DUF2459 domain-containing protein [Chitinophagaceae bacterium]|nr:DUF2459 domain-containing protein [Chitinophagaceae bacterium]